MYAAAGVGALCISSSVASVMMNKKEEEEEVAVPAEQPEKTVEKEEVEETGIAPEQPPPPPSEPEQKQLTTPNSMRSASSVWGELGLNWKLKNCGNSMIDSPGGWCSGANRVGNWIQLDNGKIGSISGVITQGRKDADQYVKSFKVKYKDESGSWWDVDGKTFPGNKDRNTKVTTTFSKPVRARYIRIYPQTWQQHISMRADMFAGDTNTDKSPALGDIPYSGHSSSGNWAGDAIGKSHGAGRLDSTRAWSAKVSAVDQWYQLSLNTPVNISGVAMKGRPDHPQWVTSVKIQYEDENGEFKDVDGGFVFDANYDKNSLVKIFFEKPLKSKSIRFYPQSWHGHMSARFGILRGGEVSSTEKYQIMGYTL
tara:strand:+ start:92 stop:1195 length:1104 start_codon:yes stop_codon:yes gene_type:complete